jgi:hypothetical protein
MKTHISEFLLIVSYIITFSSCEYETIAVYNRSVNKNVVAPTIQTVELNLNSDTITIYSDSTIIFKFSSSNQAINSVDFLIDGNLLSSVNSNTGVFNLQYNTLSEGIHSITIQVYTCSGTGSIADHLGAEVFLYSKSWKLNVIK